MRGTPARRAPDRCNVSHGTLHLHDGCEAARQRGCAPGPSETSIPGRLALHPTAPSAPGFGASKPKAVCLALPPVPQQLSSLWTLIECFLHGSKYLPSPVLTLPAAPPPPAPHLGYSISSS